SAASRNRAFGALIRSFQACGGRRSGCCGPQIEKPFEIPSDCDQGPFTGSCTKSTQMKLAKTQHGFDNPEYGLDRALALRIDPAACHGCPAWVHRLYNIRDCS